MPVKEVRRCVISSEPVLMTKEIVNLVREDQFFELDAALTQLAHKLDRLVERHISIVVSARAQVLASGHDVLILGRPARPAMPGLTKASAVADSASIVHRQHDVAA